MHASAAWEGSRVLWIMGVVNTDFPRISATCREIIPSAYTILLAY